MLKQVSGLGQRSQFGTLVIHIRLQAGGKV